MATALARPADWVTPDQVRELSRSLGESGESRDRRVDAFERFLQLPLEPNPLYRGYGYFTNVDLSGLDAITTGPAVPLPAAPRGAVRCVHDATGTHATIPSELQAAGLRLTLLSESWGANAVKDRFAEGEEPTDRLSALSLALLNRGYLLEVPDGLGVPVHVQDLTVLSRPHEAFSVRRVVRAGSNTQLMVTEEVYSGPAPPGGQRFYASNTDLDLQAGAKAVYLTMHAPDLQAVSVYDRSATTGPGSRLAWLWAGLGGFRSKARNRTRLLGQGSVVEDLQLFYGAGDQSYDSSVHLTHLGTDTHGQSITRGVFTDRARGMSRGLVRIEKGAAKTLSFISEHAMLLAKGARSDTIPILEILCRDVKATHSTSVHPVDPEQVFYLESRGIAEADAVRMIGEGFLSYVLDRAPITSLRDHLFPALEARWNGVDLPWTSDGARALPELQVTGAEGSPEWRFDTKLR
jgi:Fe-S cluster assembly scaffold protein SufB